MPRQIATDIHWIYERGPDRSEQFNLGSRDLDWYEDGYDAYIPQCAYLIVGDEETLLFDTLSPAATDHLLETVDDILGDRELDYLVISHPDIPHAGNAAVVLDAYPAVELVAPGYGNDHDLYQLGTATHVVEGDTIDLGDRVVEFHEATFLDAPVSVWMTERTSGTLFTVDWMGFPHLDSNVLSFVDEGERAFDIEQFVEFHSRVLFWYQYADVEKVQREIANVERKFEPEIIAPAHGQVIRTDTEEFFKMMKRVPEIVDRRGRVGTLG